MEEQIKALIADYQERLEVMKSNTPNNSKYIQGYREGIQYGVNTILADLKQLINQ